MTLFHDGATRQRIYIVMYVYKYVWYAQGDVDQSRLLTTVTVTSDAVTQV